MRNSEFPFLNSTTMRLFKSVFLIFIILGCSAPETFEVGKIETRLGEAYVWLYNDTPEHKKAFLELAKGGYFNDYSFNRVIESFVAQGGCPDTTEGFAYSVHLLEPEFDAGHRHVYGAFGAGRDANPHKLSAACQFYIVQNEDGLSRLDNNYMIYGHVFKGMDVIDKIVLVDTDSLDQPTQEIPLTVSVVEMTASDLQRMGWDVEKEDAIGASVRSYE